MENRGRGRTAAREREREIVKREREGGRGVREPRMERRMDRQRNYSRMLRSGNGAFYCAFVIVKLSGQFCVGPIYAHVSLMCTRAILPSRPEMARYVGLHNFAKFSAARTRRKRYMETKTSVVFRYVRSLLFLLPYRKIYIRGRLSLSLSVVDKSIFIG